MMEISLTIKDASLIAQGKLMVGIAQVEIHTTLLFALNNAATIL